MSPLLVDVALPVPLRQLFTYRVPPGLKAAAKPGVRVLVLFANKQLIGYLVKNAERAPEATLRDIIDVLDAEPLFGPDLMALFEWVARYYHEALGEVIRAGLPAGLGVAPKQIARLTPEGQARLDVLLEAEPLSRTERVLMRALLGAPMAVSALLARAKARHIDLAGCVQNGWVLVGDRGLQLAEKTEKVAEWLGAPNTPPVSGKERAVAEAIEQAGRIPVKALNETFKSVAPNLKRLEASGAIRVVVERVWRRPDAPSSELAGDTAPVALNDVQTAVVEQLGTAIRNRQPTGFLLHGVTGSGKTEVYLQAIAIALEQGLGSVTLVPEIALTPQLVARFQARFGERIAVLHSALTPGERLDEWHRIATGQKPVVVGARSAIFAPLSNLGLVVVDEEHESSFKQGERPRYHARDLALVRGRLASCPVVLGSATPSLESVVNALSGKLTLLSMPVRAKAQRLPVVDIIDLRRTQRIGESRLISQPLALALQETLSRGEQAILFLNRRGFSSFLLCTACGFIPECPSCSISLSYTRSQDVLRCHYCGHRSPVPTRCPQCHSAALDTMGAGTERAVDDVQALVGADTVVERMDSDTAQGPALEALLKRFRRGEIQVLVGTQMVTKGHDFPNVTLVGVLAADQSLKFPDFRSGERTFQLVTQVAGRAGRGNLQGRVIVQTWSPEHHSLRAAASHDFHAFRAIELARRQEQAYPPYTHLALVLITHTDEATVQLRAGELADVLRAAARQPGQTVLGPVWAPVQRIKNKTRAQLLLKATARPALHQLLTVLDAFVDAQSLHGDVAVDVDPIHLL